LGTANQVDVSASTGAVTVSLDSAITLPGSLTATGAVTLQTLTMTGASVLMPTLGSDTASTAFYQQSQNAYWQSATNVSGSKLSIASGLGTKYVTIVSFSGLTATTAVVVNGATTTFTAVASGATGLQFNAQTSNSATASNLATVINANISSSALSATAVGANVYLQPVAGVTYQLAVATSDFGSHETCTGGLDGDADVYGNNINITAETATGNVTVGTVNITGAASGFNNPGAVNITGGAALVQGGTLIGGPVNIKGGVSAVNATAGQVSITGGSPAASSNGQGGLVAIAGGPSGVNSGGVSGAVTVYGGSAASGSTNIASGNVTAGSGTSTGNAAPSAFLVVGAPAVSGGASGTGTNATVTLAQLKAVQNDLSSASFSTGAVVDVSDLTFGDGGGSGTGSFCGLRIAPTLNYTNATKAQNFTAFLIQQTNTSAPTGTLNLLDAQVGGSSKFTVSSTGLTTWADGANFVVGTSTGTEIGTSTSQKIGFFGTTPAIQTTGSTDVVAGLVTLGLRAATSNPPINVGTGTVTCGSVVAPTFGTTSAANANLQYNSGTVLSMVGKATSSAATSLEQVTGVTGMTYTVGLLHTSTTVNSGTSVNLGVNVPANSTILAITYRITTTITGASGTISLEDSGGNVYLSQSTLTANTTIAGGAYGTSGTFFNNFYASANTFKIVSGTGSFTAGVVETQIVYATVTPPTS
jgi:hypothetical protein